MTAETDFPSNGSDTRGLTDKSAWVSMQRGPFRWDVKACVGHWLNEDDELPLSVWQKGGQASIIKTGPHRTVYRLNLPEGNFYLKHYRIANWQTVLQNLVRPSKADLEWNAARKIADLGLPTFETVAIGRKKHFGLVRDNFLISREIEQAEPLDQFVLWGFSQLDSLSQQAARRDIARQLGKMTAILHRNGVLHRDFHPGNVLLRHQDEGWNLFLIDLHATSWKRRLSLQQAAENLSLLNNFFARLTSKSDRLRFLKSYNEHGLAGQTASTPLNPETVKCIDEICQRELAKADLRGDKKWKRGNRRLVILNRPPNHCRGLANLGIKQLRQLCEHPETLFEQPTLIAWQKREVTFHRGLADISWKGKPQTAIVTAFAKAHRARQAWEMGHALVRRRLPAPRPLLFVETPKTKRDYLVTEQVPRAVSLKHWLMEVHPSLPPSEKRRAFHAVLMAVAIQLRRLHEHGFDQPELHPRSFLIQQEESAPRIWFTSLETLERPHRMNRSRVQRGLASWFSSVRLVGLIGLADCLRFLRAYLAADFRREWKSDWRAIARLLVKTSRQEAA